MERTIIDPLDFTTRIAHLWDKDWLLLGSGDVDAGRYNAMTVAWGSFGVMWGRPFAQVVVRPSRHTFGLMNAYDSFTLSAFSPQWKKALGLLGSKSGRDGDKIAESGLRVVRGVVAAAPTFPEAILSIECRKLYWQDMDPGHFLDPAIEGSYNGSDYHRIYFGEIMHLEGSADFRG
ncbi:MAG: flavin reductase [Anaerolineae bacterium]|nr:flavin reductase [Anaerolineae bacterium]